MIKLLLFQLNLVSEDALTDRCRAPINCYVEVAVHRKMELGVFWYEKN